MKLLVMVKQSVRDLYLHLPNPYELIIWFILKFSITLPNQYCRYFQIDV